MVGARGCGRGSVRRGGVGAAIALAALAAFAAGARGIEAQAGRAAFEEGRRQLAANEPGKAERQFEKAIAAEPNVGVYQLWLGRAIGLQTLNASIVRQPFLARRTKAAFEKATKLDPTLIDPREHLIVYFLQAPSVMGGSVPKAREHAREIAKLDASRGHLAMASIEWHAKDTVATERSIRAAIAAAPDSVVPVLQLAQRLETWRRVDESFAALDAFLERHPTDIAVRFRLGRMAASTGQQLPRGEVMLRALLAAPDWAVAPGRPTRAGVQYRLGQLLVRSGRTAEARAAYQAALTLDPRLQAARDALASLKD